MVANNIVLFDNYPEPLKNRSYHRQIWL